MSFVLFLCLFQAKLQSSISEICRTRRESVDRNQTYTLMIKPSRRWVKWTSFHSRFSLFWGTAVGPRQSCRNHIHLDSNRWTFLNTYLATEDANWCFAPTLLAASAAPVAWCQSKSAASTQHTIPQDIKKSKKPAETVTPVVSFSFQMPPLAVCCKSKGKSICR